MKCDKCYGTGQLRDPREFGTEMRLKRKRARISLRAMAEALEFTPPYISDLELGRRNWTFQLSRDYLKVLIRKGKA